MKDLTDIRIFIRRTWREYKHSQITLNSAAITTNTAIDVMRRLNEAFLESFPAFAGHTSLIEYLYDAYIDPKAKAANIADDENFASYEGEGIRLSYKTFFCDHTASLVREFFVSGSLPMYQEHMMHGKGVAQDEHILLQCLSHFNILDWRLNGPQGAKRGSEIVFDDQVLRPVRTMRVEKRFPTWAVFACQIFVDTRRELGPHLDRGFEDLKKQGSWLLQTWNDCLETGKQNAINDYHKLNNQSIEQQIDRLKSVVEEDLVQEIIDNNFSKHPEKRAHYNWGRCFLLRNHPLMCGLIAHAQLVFGHVSGTRIAADQGPVRTAIHLTHAVALAGVIPVGRAWADLDYIVEKHGNAYLFVGERPTRIVDCFRRMYLAFGSSASIFSMDKNKQVDNSDLKRERDPPSIQRLHRRLLPMSRYAEASTKLNSGKFQPTRAAQDTFVMMELLINRLMNSRDITCPANPSNEKIQQKTHFMTPPITYHLQASP